MNIHLLVWGLGLIICNSSLRTKPYVCISVRHSCELQETCGLQGDWLLLFIAGINHCESQTVWGILKWEQGTKINFSLTSNPLTRVPACRMIEIGLQSRCLLKPLIILTLKDMTKPQRGNGMLWKWPTHAYDHSWFWMLHQLCLNNLFFVACKWTKKNEAIWH